METKHGNIFGTAYAEQQLDFAAIAGDTAALVQLYKASQAGEGKIGNVNTVGKVMN